MLVANLLYSVHTKVGKRENKTYLHVPMVTYRNIMDKKHIIQLNFSLLNYKYI